jgi:hypothetical protein
MPVASFAGMPAAANAEIELGVTLVVLASEHSAIQAYYSNETLTGLRQRAGR